MGNCCKVNYGSDTEYRTVIPMDATSTHTPPSGPMTRARAHAIDTEVNSLLSQISLNTSETWMLPQVQTLCVIRYQDEEDGAATSGGQEDMDTKLERKEKGDNSSHRTTGPDRTSGPWSILAPNCHCPNVRHGPEIWQPSE
jgi:hypothetical protein